jgi:hypothetical protein
MPKQIVVKITWSVKKPLLMASFAKEVATDMTGNATYPQPPVKPSDLADAAELVIKTYALRNNGAEAKTNFENALSDLDNMLHLQEEYVSHVAAGDTLKIESAGFVATTNERNAAVRPEAPNASKLTALGGGRLKSSVNKVIGATDYTHIFYTDPDSIIVLDQFHISFSSAKGGKFIVATGGLYEEVSGLPELTKAYVIVVAHNSAGYSNASPAVSIGVI